jgi:DNA-binding NarL/FixJ family response regulator
LQGYWNAREMFLLPQSMEGLAAAAAGLGDHARGARLLGCAAAVRERIGSPIPAPRQYRYDRIMAAIRARLDDEAFARAESEGRSWMLDKAIAYALEPLDVPKSAPVTTPASILTPRELDVLRLLVDGRSNTEIAEELSISPHTAATHVANIMNKLGVDSRTAAAAWAIRQGIA